MQYFPINIRLAGERVALIGGGEDAVAKLRLLLKTDAKITVFAKQANAAIMQWQDEGKLQLISRPFAAADRDDLRLVYLSGEDPKERDAVLALLAPTNIPYCVIDDLDRSRFITPAIIDRDPVTVAIGTEGTAPMLARRIKAMIEENLPQHTGMMARLAGQFRHHLARFSGSFRRLFWGQFFDEVAPRLASSGDAKTAPRWHEAMEALLNDLEQSSGDDLSHPPIAFVSAGPGDPDLMTVKARKALDTAEVVLYDRLVSSAIIELARREATLIEVGKTGFGQAMSQDAINRLLISYGKTGAKVVRLKSGDAGIYGRLDEEIKACDEAGLSYRVIPGVTSAVAASAEMGVSMTRRGRNSELRYLTARDVRGFADYQWQDLAAAGSVSAVYMGLRAIPYLQGRLLMHGADPAMPVTLAARVSQPNQSLIATTLAGAVHAAEAENLTGPVVIMLGLSPHQSAPAKWSDEEGACYPSLPHHSRTPALGQAKPQRISA
jgi:uroporphyrin-III C-methyltransferase/precorrin-2 dehydrogenase/sirohydrochlorin ferrochelatase